MGENKRNRIICNTLHNNMLHSKVTYGTCTDTSKGLCLNPSVAVAVAVGKIYGRPGTLIGFKAAVSRAYICNCEKRRKDKKWCIRVRGIWKLGQREGEREQEKEGERVVLRQKDRDREERKVYVHIYV